MLICSVHRSGRLQHKHTQNKHRGSSEWWSAQNAKSVNDDVWLQLWPWLLEQQWWWWWLWRQWWWWSWWWVVMVVAVAVVVVAVVVVGGWVVAMGENERK
jgi:ribose/xylose/arabinose/galactoside ABC-type transport system permease subunit